MDIIQLKIVVTAGFFVVIFVSGYWLYREGPPFSMGMVTVHKMFSLGAIVYLVMAILNINKMAPLGRVELIACIVTGLLFLGAAATGAIMSAAKNLPPLAQALHKVLSVLTVLSTAAAFFLLFRRR
jgi:hypothetical protein